MTKELPCILHCFLYNQFPPPPFILFACFTYQVILSVAFQVSYDGERKGGPHIPTPSLRFISIQQQCTGKPFVVLSPNRPLAFGWLMPTKNGRPWQSLTYMWKWSSFFFTVAHSSRVVLPKYFPPSFPLTILPVGSTEAKFSLYYITFPAISTSSQILQSTNQKLARPPHGEELKWLAYS